MTKFEVIPPEVLLLIFSFLDDEDLLKCSYVNTFFCKVHSHEIIWNNLFEKKFSKKKSNIVRREKGPKMQYFKKRFIERGFQMGKWKKINVPKSRQVFSVDIIATENGKTNILSCTGGIVELLQFQSGKSGLPVVRTFQEHKDVDNVPKLIFSSIVSHSSNTMACSGSSQYLELYEFNTGKFMDKIDVGKKGVWAMAKLKDSQICCATSDGKVKLFDVKKKKKVCELEAKLEDQIVNVPMYDVAKINENVICATNDRLNFFDLRVKESLVHSIENGNKRVYEMDVCENMLAFGSINGWVNIVDIRNLKENKFLYKTLISVGQSISGLRLDRNKMVVGSKKGYVILKKKEKGILKLNSTELLMKEKVNEMGFVPVFNEVMKTLSISDLDYNDQHMFIAANQRKGNILVYDIFHRTKKDDDYCTIQ